MCEGAARRRLRLRRRTQLFVIGVVVTRGGASRLLGKRLEGRSGAQKIAHRGLLPSSKIECVALLSGVMQLCYQHTCVRLHNGTHLTVRPALRGYRTVLNVCHFGSSLSHYIQNININKCTLFKLYIPLLVGKSRCTSLALNSSCSAQ